MILLCLVVVLINGVWLRDLYQEYGAGTDNRSAVTHPTDVTIFLRQALEVCDKNIDIHPEQCKSAIQGISNRIALEDIDAQRSMARSALGILHLNFWQIVLNAILSLVVGWTLIETRRTASASVRAADAAENSVRAHLYPTVRAEFSYKDDDSAPDPNYDYMDFEKRRINISFYVKNYGKTPARNIQFGITMVCDEINETPFDSKQWIDMLEEGGKPEFITSDFFATRLFVTESNNKKPVARVTIEYDDVFGSIRVKSQTLFYADFYGEGLSMFAHVSDDADESTIANSIDSIHIINMRAEYEKLPYDGNMNKSNEH